MGAVPIDVLTPGPLIASSVCQAVADTRQLESASLFRGSS